MSDTQLTAKTHDAHKTVIALNDQVTVGGSDLLIVGGPCSVESLEQMETVATHLAKAPVQALRGGV